MNKGFQILNSEKKNKYKKWIELKKDINIPPIEPFIKNKKKYLWFLSPIQLLTKKQWWSNTLMQLSQYLQWLAEGGLNILQDYKIFEWIFLVWYFFHHLLFVVLLLLHLLLILYNLDDILE